MHIIFNKLLVSQFQVVIMGSVKHGLWTGLDYGLDWTGLTKAAVCIHHSLSPARPQVASLLLNPRIIIFSISERSKVTCIFNKLQQRWLGLTPCGFFDVLNIHDCFLWMPHASGGVSCLYTAVLVSPVQSRVQVLQRPRYYGNCGVTITLACGAAE